MKIDEMRLDEKRMVELRLDDKEERRLDGKT